MARADIIRALGPACRVASNDAAIQSARAANILEHEVTVAKLSQLALELANAGLLTASFPLSEPSIKPLPPACQAWLTKQCSSSPQQTSLDGRRTQWEATRP